MRHPTAGTTSARQVATRVSPPRQAQRPPRHHPLLTPNDTPNAHYTTPTHHIPRTQNLPASRSIRRLDTRSGLRSGLIGNSWCWGARGVKRRRGKARPGHAVEGGRRMRSIWRGEKNLCMYLVRCSSEGRNVPREADEVEVDQARVTIAVSLRLQWY